MQGAKHRNQLQGPELPIKYPTILVENSFDIKESDGNMFNLIF